MNDKLWLAQWFRRGLEGLFMIGGWAFAIAATALAASAYPEHGWLAPLPMALAFSASLHCFIRRYYAEKELEDGDKREN